MLQHFLACDRVRACDGARQAAVLERPVVPVLAVLALVVEVVSLPYCSYDLYVHVGHLLLDILDLARFHSWHYFVCGVGDRRTLRHG